MNNEQEINTMLEDFKSNEEYFKSIEKAKGINSIVETKLNKYRDTIQKIMEMVNVNRILNLEIPVNTRWDSSGRNKVVLTNKGLRSRYITSNYKPQSQELDVKEYSRIFPKSIEVIFKHPEISTVQKNKIKPLKYLDVSFLNNIVPSETISVEGVMVFTQHMDIKKMTVVIPDFDDANRYRGLTNLSLLSIRNQITDKMNEFLTERNNTISLLETKTKELEALFPIVFLFDN